MPFNGLSWSSMALDSELKATSRPTAFEFQLQFAVPAEDLRCVRPYDLRRMKQRVEMVLALAAEACEMLEPLGWRLLTVRFEEEVCVVLTRLTTAEDVRRDLERLPASVLASIGDTMHICATVGEHIYELAYIGGSLRPLSPADSR